MRLARVWWAAIMATSLVGCAQGLGAAPEITSSAPVATAITIWVDAAREPVLKPVAEKFTKRSGIEVKFVIKTDTFLRQEMTTALSSDNRPDVFVGSHDNIGSWATAGLISPIDLGNHAGDFHEVATKAMSYDGKFFGVPQGMNNLALIRNIDLVAQPPTSFAEVLSTGQEVVNTGKASRPIVVAHDSAQPPLFLYPLQTSMGAPFFVTKTDGGFDGTKFAMCGAEGDQWERKLRELGTQKVFDLDQTKDAAITEFAAAKAPYLIAGPQAMAAIRKSATKYTVEAIPPLGDKPAYNLVEVQGFFATAKGTHQTEAAKFLLEVIADQQVQTDLYKISYLIPASKLGTPTSKSEVDSAEFGSIASQSMPIPNVGRIQIVWKYWGPTQIALLHNDERASWKSMCQNLEN